LKIKEEGEISDKEKIGKRKFLQTSNEAGFGVRSAKQGAEETGIVTQVTFFLKIIWFKINGRLFLRFDERDYNIYKEEHQETPYQGRCLIFCIFKIISLPPTGKAF
jgi:hypothetical protein